MGACIFYCLRKAIALLSFQSPSFSSFSWALTFEKCSRKVIVRAVAVVGAKMGWNSDAVVDRYEIAEEGLFRTCGAEQYEV